LIGDGQDRVGVRKVDELRGQEGVQQGLDRRIGRRRVEQVAAELVHHLFVGEGRKRAQAAQVLEIEGGESRRLDRVEVPARTLDVDGFDRVAEEVAVHALDRG